MDHHSSSSLKASLLTILISCLLSALIGVLISTSSNKTSLVSMFKDLKSKCNLYFGRTSKPLLRQNRLISLLDQKFPIAAVEQKHYYVAPATTELETRETEVGRAVVPMHPEAHAALKLAAQMKAQGKIAKAKKLLLQCKALSPHHPDILNDYGEAVEDTDVIDAEHHYALALVFNPGHLKAMKNRLRTIPLVKQKDVNMLRRIERKREALMQIPEGNAALQRAKMEAYYRHIYHSNAIEGNTMTLSMTRAIVESGIAIGGKSIHEHNEVIGLDSALKYMNNTLLSRIGNIGIEDIVNLHRRVFGHVNPVEAGVFRKTQVYVGDHVPPHPADLERLMLDFDDWLYSHETDVLHPIELASLAHYKLVFIHPFTDGNGRTARLLMNLFLMQAGYPPVIIRKEERFQYYDYLQQGNLGDIRPFIRFVARCTEKSLDEYLSSVTIYPRKIKYRRLQDEHKLKETETLTMYDDIFMPNGECKNPHFKHSYFPSEAKKCPRRTNKNQDYA